MRAHRVWIGAVAAIAAAGCSGAPPGGEALDEATAEIEAETGRLWITIGADAIDTARAALARGATGAGVAPAALGGGAALLEVDARDLKLLSEAMHEGHRRCGGFMVHDGPDGRASGMAALRASARPTAAGPVALAPSYALDDGPLVAALLPELREANIVSMIQQLSANPTRYYTSTSGIAVSGWLRDKWASYAAGRPEIKVELFTHPQFSQQSVIATIPGTTKANEVVVLGGHLDSVAGGGAGVAPGADDDASGIATLSEVLRVLAQKNLRPARTLKLMAYAAEEVGLRGSRGLAADAQAKGTAVVGVLQLDMTNYKGSPRDIYLITDYTNAAQNTFVGALIDTYVGATWGTDVCGYACSDHAAWHELGFPASMPAEARFADINPAIHSANDTLSQSGNGAAHALKFAKLAVAFAAELGQGSVGGPVNAAPTITISKPAPGQRLGPTVELAAAATDPEDWPLSDRLAWASSRDGALGTGATKTVKLSPGEHTITATAQDSAGAVAMATAAVTIDVDAGSDDDGVAGGCAAGGAGAGGALGAALALALARLRRRRP
jgi:leucyl aminopeptidase